MLTYVDVKHQVYLLTYGDVKRGHYAPGLLTWTLSTIFTYGDVKHHVYLLTGTLRAMFTYLRGR